MKAICSMEPIRSEGDRFKAKLKFQESCVPKESMKVKVTVMVMIQFLIHFTYNFPHKMWFPLPHPTQLPAFPVARLSSWPPEDEIRRRGLKVDVVGIPKMISNDIPVLDKYFGFDTAVEEAQRTINAAHVEAESNENGIGFVELMGRYSGN